MRSPNPARPSLRVPIGACLLLLLFVTGSPAPARAADAPSPTPTLTPREIVRQAAEPILDVFARSPDGPNHALSLHLRLAEATNQPPELQGSVLAFRCQPPDQVFFQFAAVGTIVTIGRQGQTVWVAPASRLRPLLDRAIQTPPTKAQQEPISPLRLKLPKALIWLAFRFVGVRDAGAATVDGVPYRKIDIDTPDDEKPDKNSGVRFWVRTDQYQPTRLDWHNTDAHGTLVIEDAKLLPGLPAEAFRPEEAQRADMMVLPVPQFRQLMTLLGKEEEKRAKAQVAQQKLATKPPGS